MEYIVWSAPAHVDACGKPSVYDMVAVLYTPFPAFFLRPLSPLASYSFSIVAISKRWYYCTAHSLCSLFSAASYGFVSTYPAAPVMHLLSHPQALGSSDLNLLNPSVS